ncbi:putative centrosomal protein CEP72 [Paratrimastix pyriformis]|uniref:Centrosomal protein CEP72 n=1 Tax=Paratrimastix pyriformis TaxID=342808 RepID=A0ABQ8UHS1_9EUKA|nr:putative centrosomal protein CEP72 [Paratrimastix pyriformis]
MAQGGCAAYVNMALDSLEPSEKVRGAETLILSGNRLHSLGFLSKCDSLWNLDLTKNRISSLDAVRPLAGLGRLWLGENALTWPEVIKLRHMSIIELTLVGNPELGEHYRPLAIHMLPRVWVLDGWFVSMAERLHAAAWCTRGPGTEVYAMLRAYCDAAPSPLSSTLRITPRAKAFFRHFARDPPSTRVAEQRRIRFTATHYEAIHRMYASWDPPTVEVYAQFGGPALGATASPRAVDDPEPPFYVAAVLGASPLARYQLCVLLAARLRFSLPPNTLRESLARAAPVLDGLPSAHLATMPPYAITSYLSFLLDFLQRDRSLGSLPASEVSLPSFEFLYHETLPLPPPEYRAAAGPPEGAALSEGGQPTAEEPEAGGEEKVDEKTRIAALDVYRLIQGTPSYALEKAYLEPLLKLCGEPPEDSAPASTRRTGGPGPTSARSDRRIPSASRPGSGRSSHSSGVSAIGAPPNTQRQPEEVRGVQPGDRVDLGAGIRPAVVSSVDLVSGLVRAAVAPTPVPDGGRSSTPPGASPDSTAVPSNPPTPTHRTLSIPLGQLDPHPTLPQSWLWVARHSGPTSPAPSPATQEPAGTPEKWAARAKSTLPPPSRSPAPARAWKNHAVAEQDLVLATQGRLEEALRLAIECGDPLPQWVGVEAAPYTVADGSGVAGLRPVVHSLIVPPVFLSFWPIAENTLRLGDEADGDLADFYPGYSQFEAYRSRAGLTFTPVSTLPDQPAAAGGPPNSVFLTELTALTPDLPPGSPIPSTSDDGPAVRSATSAPPPSPAPTPTPTRASAISGAGRGSVRVVAPKRTTVASPTVGLSQGGQRSLALVASSAPGTEGGSLRASCTSRDSTPGRAASLARGLVGPQATSLTRHARGATTKTAGGLVAPLRPGGMGGSGAGGGGGTGEMARTLGTTTVAGGGCFAERDHVRLQLGKVHFPLHPPCQSPQPTFFPIYSAAGLFGHQAHLVVSPTAPLKRQVFNLPGAEGPARGATGLPEDEEASFLAAVQQAHALRLKPAAHQHRPSSLPAEEDMQSQADSPQASAREDECVGHVERVFEERIVAGADGAPIWVRRDPGPPRFLWLREEDLLPEELAMATGCRSGGPQEEQEQEQEDIPPAAASPQPRPGSGPEAPPAPRASREQTPP